MNKFSGCLTQGKFYENETLQYLNYDLHQFSVGKVKEWDIQTIKDGVITHYEVKSETNAFKYGNLCIEFSYNGSKSGIDATIADYWVHYAVKDKPNNIYVVFIIPTQELKQMINEKKYFRIIQGGDQNKSGCYLFKMGMFDKYKIVKN
jgi:hypothetical protein|tara:strand:- start:7865 stop:8308 length:444 start_codon:yes stop_codon:yes gene_type:complete